MSLLRIATLLALLPLLTPSAARAQGPSEELLVPGGYFRAEDFRSPRPVDRSYAQALTTKLGGKAPLGLQGFAVPDRKPRLPGAQGLAFRVRLPQGYLGVVRMRCESAEKANEVLTHFFGEGSSGFPGRLLQEQRRRDLVWIMGDDTLKDPKQASRYLNAAWSVGKAPPKATESTLLMLSQSRGGRSTAQAFHTQRRGNLSTVAGVLLRALREWAAVDQMGEGPATPEWRRRLQQRYGGRIAGMRRRFLDQAQNELRAGEGQAEYRIAADASGTTYTRALSEAQLDTEWTYLEGLLRERGTPIRVGKETVKLELPIDPKQR